MSLNYVIFQRKENPNFNLFHFRQRLRRTEKIVDKILNEDDLDLDGALGFVEFAAAFHAGKMAGLKVKK